MSAARVNPIRAPKGDPGDGGRAPGGCGMKALTVWNPDRATLQALREAA